MVDSTVEQPGTHRDDSTIRSFNVAWPFVFGLNLVVPLLFAEGATRQSGRIGMTLAILLFLLVSWFIGNRNPRNGKRLIVGGSLVALSQLFPLLHIVSGMIGYTITQTFGEATDPAEGTITSEFGGFVCTFSTGSALVTSAFAIGWLFVALGGTLGSKSNPN